jgi:hypothetical protein
MILTFCSASAATAVEVTEEWLREVREHILALQAQVDKLTDEVIQLEKDKHTLAMETEYWRDRNRRQQGLYLGGHASYPLGGSAMVLYKWERWGLYSSAGYHNGFAVGIGALIRIGSE